VIALWSRVLGAVPGSRLVLKWKSLADAAECARLRQAFAAHAIDPERLDLRGRSPHAAMLAEYGDVDIALDPFPFCGGLTSCEALWMGVPIVTLPGSRAVSRQTLGFLSPIGLAELSAETAERYVAIAAGLAGDRDRLAALRAGLRDRMAASPLWRRRRVRARARGGVPRHVAHLVSEQPVVAERIADPDEPTRRLAIDAEAAVEIDLLGRRDAPRAAMLTSCWGRWSRG